MLGGTILFVRRAILPALETFFCFKTLRGAKPRAIAWMPLLPGASKGNRLSTMEARPGDPGRASSAWFSPFETKGRQLRRSGATAWRASRPKDGRLARGVALSMAVSPARTAQARSWARPLCRSSLAVSSVSSRPIAACTLPLLIRAVRVIRAPSRRRATPSGPSFRLHRSESFVEAARVPARGGLRCFWAPNRRCAVLDGRLHRDGGGPLPRRSRQPRRRPRAPGSAPAEHGGGRGEPTSPHRCPRHARPRRRAISTTLSAGLNHVSQAWYLTRERRVQTLFFAARTGR